MASASRIQRCHSYGSDLIPGLGTSTCPGRGRKRKISELMEKARETCQNPGWVLIPLDSVFTGAGGVVVLAFKVVAPAARQMLTEAAPAEPALPPPASQWEEFRQPADPPKP